MSANESFILTTLSTKDVLIASSFFGCGHSETPYVQLSNHFVDINRIILESGCYATVDEFPSRKPADLLALGLRLASDDRLLYSNLRNLGRRALTVLATQLFTYFRLANQPIFWSFASALHATVASFRAILISVAASAGVGTNALPLTSAQ